MPTYRDHAVVLRTHKLGEADRIITLLSRSHGKVRAVARGVRRTSSKFGGRLEPFSHVDVQFATGRSLDVVTQVDTLHAYDVPLRIDYGAFTAGQAMLEAADRLVAEEGEPALRQYRLLLGALRTLGEGTPCGPRPATMVLDSYLLRALTIAGYAPALTSCARCGVDGPHAGFAPETGGMVCVSCRPPRTALPAPPTWQLLS
ncbi:MAG: DNA repair protein RecO, partial [Brooklawnia sp.]|nr:DNA repair protein RecO [Brooklawnia sp.]